MLVVFVCSTPDCGPVTFVESGAFGWRRPTQFVVTAGSVNPCSTPQIANTTKHSTTVGLILFSGHKKLEVERVMKNQEPATVYKDNPKPWAPRDLEDTMMIASQAATITTLAIHGWR